MDADTRFARRLAWSAPLILAVACAEDVPTETVQSRVALSRLSTCSAVERHLEDQLIEESRRRIEDLKDGGGIRGPIFADGGPGVPEAGAGGSRDDANQTPSPDEYTDTNLQESGVDEADFVKTDGVRTFVLSGRTLYATQSWPPEALAVENSLEISGYPHEMFLTEDDQIVVFSNDAEASAGGGGPDEPGAVDCWAWGCERGRGLVRVTVIDASGVELRERYQITLPGSYQASRRIGDAVRIVVGEPIYRPEGLRYWPEGAIDWDDEDARHEALDALHAQNVRRIRAADLTDFLPQSVRVDEAGNEVVLERECSRFHQPNAPVPLGLTTLATLEVDSARLQRTSVFGAAHTVYASTETLYMGSNHWWWRPTSGQRTHTYVHAFDFTDDFSSSYRGSFGVAGTLLDQFSMDEHDGHIRVATHVRTFLATETEWRPPRLTNRVTVYRKDRFGFTQTGRTRDLAENEAIFAARMEGDKGFVVTFERIDPLFTLDLADPTDPRVIGELKVPGFSTYIHFLGEDHLLTIGEHIPDPQFPGDNPRGLKLTIFDVSDFEDPTEEHVEYLGEAYSEASWDHKAFNLFERADGTNTLAIPVSRWTGRWDRFLSELWLFDVDPRDGFTKKPGAISMSDVYPRPEEWGSWYRPYVRRSIMADGYAYAISDAGIRVAPIDTPSRTLATCRFR